MSAHPAPPVSRKDYLDWLRGIAVLVMVQGHVIDSWTAPVDRQRDAYHLITVVGGIGGAPLFLWLAGVGMALAGAARMRRGWTREAAAAFLRRRGWQIFGLAFLFRLQSWLISGGSPRTLLKVDILNIMGLTMVGAAVLWGAGRSRWSRAGLLLAATAAVPVLTPLVRASGVLAGLPDVVEAYLRPAVDATTFSLFPWAGFLLAGCLVGLWLETPIPERERRAVRMLGVAGGALALAAYGATLLPSMYAASDFWRSSPAYVFIRIGILLMLLGAAFAWNARQHGARWSPTRVLGRSSLFVYWIHVEMVYGVVSMPLHRRLTLEQAYLGFLLMLALLYGLTQVKNRLSGRMQPPSFPFSLFPFPFSSRPPLRQNAMRQVILAMTARLSFWPVRSSRRSL